MPAAHFRFYAELNDLLPVPHRQRDFEAQFEGHESIKHLIEALGVPHTEVDLILVNGQAVDFSYPVKDGDQISVYPQFESVDITQSTNLRPKPLREPRFVLDTHLGRLAAYLRLLGFDTLYRNDYPDEELARISVEEKRILLSKDRGLLKRKQLTHAYCVRSSYPRQQLFEVTQRFDLYSLISPFQRCLRCNGRLEPVAKEAIQHRLQPGTRKNYDEFYLCQDCQQIYWPGSHYQHMQQLVEDVRQAAHQKDNS